MQTEILSDVKTLLHPEHLIKSLVPSKEISSSILKISPIDLASPDALLVISTFASNLGLIIALVAGLVNALVYAFVSSSWTLGYLELTATAPRTKHQSASY